MAAIQAKEVLGAKSPETIEERFQRLEARWNAETAHLSSTSKIVSHSAFQEIISMGSAVVPLMLREMEQRPRLWVWALPKITGVDPVPVGDRDSIALMTQAWLKWAKENGVQW